MTDEILPAVGVALKPQLQVIPAKALSFEDAEQLMCGNGDTTRKGIWEQAWALSSRLALEASVAIVKPTPHLPSSFRGHLCGQQFKLSESPLGQDAGHWG